jgi:HEAT repeat protein
MNEVPAELILDPAHLADVSPYQLLEAAAAGYVGVDHRFLHAIVDRPESSIPAMVRFVSEDREDDRVDLDTELIDIFRHLRTPAAIPFLIELARRDALNVDDSIVETLVQFGATAVEPLLQLLKEIEDAGEDAGDVPFLLSQLPVRDPRILEALEKRLADGDPDAALYLDMYGDPAAIPVLEAALARLPDTSIDAVRIKSFIEDLSSKPQGLEEEEEPFDIWSLYPDEDSPPLEMLEDEDRLAMLRSGSAELRAQVAEFYRGPGFSDIAIPRLLELAKSDPDARVRGECWESLGEISNEPEIRGAMLGVLSDAGTSIEEKGGAAIALALQTDNAAVFQAIQGLYADPRSRAKALNAMGQSFDRRFADYPPRHLNDPDPEIKRQAIWGVGYLGLISEAPRLKAFFDDEEFRSDALFAYALSMPGDTSRSQVRSLLNKIDEAAGGFRPEEQGLMEIALDQRLVLRGKKPVFSADEPDDETETEPVVAPKVGRNEPCPCGSGKKYKKCCGA